MSAFVIARHAPGCSGCDASQIDRYYYYYFFIPSVSMFPREVWKIRENEKAGYV